MNGVLGRRVVYPVDLEKGKEEGNVRGTDTVLGHQKKAIRVTLLNAVSI